MIKFIKKGNKRIYFYENIWSGVAILCELPECVVCKATLTQRLNTGINNPRSNWTTVKQCMTTPHIAGRPMTKLQNIKSEIEEINNDFINLMLSMPINNEVPLIIQSKLKRSNTMSEPIKRTRGTYRVKDKRPTIHPVIIQYTQIYGLDKAIILINQRIQDPNTNMWLKSYFLLLAKLMRSNYKALDKYSSV